MPVFRSHDATSFATHGSQFTSYVAPARGSRELCAWRLDVPAHTIGTAHRVSREEVLLLTAGTIEVHIDDEPTTLDVGDVAVIPPGADFRIDNVSADPAAAWVTTSVGLEAVLGDGTRMTPPWVQ